MQEEPGIPRRYLMGVSSIAAEKCDDPTVETDDRQSDGRLSVSDHD